MILIDSSIPMYLVGATHPNKVAAGRLLESAVSRSETLATDAEVLQEVLHRYHAIDRLDAIQPAFDLVLGIVADVLPIEVVTVQRAKEVMASHPRLSARDAVHLAVRFDVCPDIERLH